MRHFAERCVVLAVMVASAALAGAGHALAEPKAVIELFTSQGCSSCVSADAYFKELAKRDDLIALSFHVDYWDFLGWKDTLGDAAHTERQRAYAETHDTRRVYTPQMIVNGTSDLVGSDRQGVEAAITKAALPVPVKMWQADGTVEIEVGALPPGPWRATIRLVLLTSKAYVDIARGENAGKTIGYYNIVRAMRPIGMWDGGKVRITLPEDELMGDGVDGCGVIVQQEGSKGPGPIIGAALIGAW